MPRAQPESLTRVIDELSQRLGKRCSVNRSILEQHSHGEDYAAQDPPDVVVWPVSTEEVSHIAALCNEHRVPLVAFGAGSSVEGQVNASHGGVCIDLSRMDQVLEMHPEDGDCVVQPGVTREGLNAYLRDTGMYFPIDPGANATLGGMISTRASGTTTIFYGTMAQNVVALEVVLADGRVIRCGTRARKSSAGYDLVRVFAGAEGTLGIITEATVRIYGRPETVGAGVCPFPDFHKAVDAVTEVIQTGLKPTRIEFIDEVMMGACNRYMHLSMPEKPTLFIEFSGSRAGVAEQFQLADTIMQGHGATPLEWSTDEARRAELWKARHNAYHAGRALRPGWESISTDICVPISALSDSVAQARRDIEAAGLTAAMVGHVGDGNYHVMFLFDPQDAGQRRTIEGINSAMIDRALAVQGTCTGEHGVGLGRRDKLRKQFGDDTLSLMRSLKRAWDPHGILNPGKMFPPAS